MNARQQKTLARFGQVLTFLDANPSIIPATAVAKQRQLLTSAVTQITGFAQDQVLKGTESILAQTLPSARTALRDIYMRQLSTVGLYSLTGQHAGDPSVPNAAQIFAMPATRTNALTLIASATAMVTAATTYASMFTAAGVSLEAVNGAIEALQAAVTASTSATRVAKGATQGIKDQIRAGRGAVQLMDVVIRPLLASNKAMQAQWESVKRAAGGHNLASSVPVPVAVPAVTGPAEVAAAPTAPVTSPAPAAPATAA
jgi:hypothetical protein